MSYQQVLQDTQASLDSLGEFLQGLTQAPEGQPGCEGQLLLDRDLTRSFWDQYHALKARLRQETLTVAVMALTKSGKSSLINALLGAQLLPSCNVPETARVTRITAADVPQPVLREASAETGRPVVVEGEEAVRAYLKYLNQDVRSRQHRKSDEAYVDVQAPAAALLGPAGAASPVPLTLLDTPGPNEAGEEALRFMVERLLDSVDAVIYLLDYTKLKTAEEAHLLAKLQGINPALAQRLSQRLFFVVNKADVMHTAEGLDAAATRAYVAALVTRTLDCPGFLLAPEQVLLVSAYEGLLARLTLLGKADASDMLKFKRRAFGSSFRPVTQADMAAAAERMLEDSGVPELQAEVLDFLCSHAGPLRLLAVQDDTLRMLHWVRNVAAASDAALRRDVGELVVEAGRLRSQLEATLGQFDAVNEQVEGVEGAVVDEVQARLQRLRERLFEHIKAVLSPGEGDEEGEEQPRVALPPASGWWAVWRKAAQLVGRGRRGEAAVRAAQERELQATLQELHADIHAQLAEEVAEFWRDLEAATNERQRQMLRGVNRLLEALSRAIEAAVAEGLAVRLEPVDIRLVPPTAEQFHASLQDLFAQGIHRRDLVETTTREEQYVVWEKRYRNSLCRTGQYFVGRPATRQVVEEKVETVFELQPDRIQDYFVEMVDHTIGNSVAAVRAYVHEYLAQRIQEARDQIGQYSERYAQTMLAALHTSLQGEEHRQAALRALGAHLARLDALLADAAATRARAEALLPTPAASTLSDSAHEAATDATALEAAADSSQAVGSAAAGSSRAEDGAADVDVVAEPPAASEVGAPASLQAAALQAAAVAAAASEDGDLAAAIAAVTAAAAAEGSSVRPQDSSETDSCSASESAASAFGGVRPTPGEGDGILMEGLAAHLASADGGRDNQHGVAAKPWNTQPEPAASDASPVLEPVSDIESPFDAPHSLTDSASAPSLVSLGSGEEEGEALFHSVAALGRGPASGSAASSMMSAYVDASPDADEPVRSSSPAAGAYAAVEQLSRAALGSSDDVDLRTPAGSETSHPAAVLAVHIEEGGQGADGTAAVAGSAADSDDWTLLSDNDAQSEG